MNPGRGTRLPLMEFEVSAELVSIYLEDAREQLAVLDAVLLRLEREGPRPELMASVLGPLHTLKGNSGMIGLVAVKDYVHRLEEVFARGRDGVLALDRAALDQLFEAATALRGAIEAACGPGREQKDLARRAGRARGPRRALVGPGAAAPRRRRRRRRRGPAKAGDDARPTPRPGALEHGARRLRASSTTCSTWWAS